MLRLPRPYFHFLQTFPLTERLRSYGHTDRTAGDGRKRWRHRPSKVVLPVRTDFLNAPESLDLRFSF